MKTVCIDLDGTLIEYDGWKGIYHFGKPLKGAIEFTHKLKEKFRVVIHTSRCNSVFNDTPIETLKEIVEGFLNKEGFYYDEVYIGNGKPVAIVYIDDRAVKFDSCQSSQKQYDNIFQNLDLTY